MPASAAELFSSVTNAGGLHGWPGAMRVLRMMSEPPAPPARELENQISRLPAARNGWSSTPRSASSTICTGVDHGPPGNARVASQISQLPALMPGRNDEKTSVRPSNDRFGPLSDAVLLSAGSSTGTDQALCAARSTARTNGAHVARTRSCMETSEG